MALFSYLAKEFESAFNKVRMHITADIIKSDLGGALMIWQNCSAPQGKSPARSICARA